MLEEVVEEITTVTHQGLVDQAVVEVIHKMELMVSEEAVEEERIVIILVLQVVQVLSGFLSK